MGFKPRMRTCACGCKKRFMPKVREQRYYDKKCRDRASQARLRERARMFSELNAEQTGSIGGS